MPKKCSGVNCKPGKPCRNEKRRGLKWVWDGIAFIATCGDFNVSIHLHEYTTPMWGTEWAWTIGWDGKEIMGSKKTERGAKAAAERWLNKKVDKMLRDLGRKRA